MTMRIVWGAMCVSILVIAATLVFVRYSNRPLPDEPVSPLPLIFGAIALLVLVLSVIIPRQVVRRTLLQHTPKLTEELAPDAVGMYREVAARRKVFAKPERVRERTAPIYYKALILALALGEAVTLFGFVLGFQGFGPVTVAPFFVVGFIANLLRFPRLSTIEQVAEKAYQASFPQRSGVPSR